MQFTRSNFPAGNSPNHGVSHHPELIRTGVVCIPHRDSALKSILSTFAGAIFAPWYREAQWFRQLAQRQNPGHKATGAHNN